MKKQLFSIATCLIYAAQLLAARKPTTISGSLPFLQSGDTVEISLNKYPDLPAGIHLYESVNVQAEGHRFEYTFDCAEPFINLSIVFKNKPMPEIRYYILAAGAGIDISENDGDYRFSGSAAADFNLQRSINRLRGSVYKDLPKHLSPENLNPYFSGIDANVQAALELLNAESKRVTPAVKEQLKADIIYGGGYQKYADLGGRARSKPEDILEAFRTAYATYLTQRKIDWDTVAIAERCKLRSPIYSNYRFARYFIDSCVLGSKPLSEHLYLEYVRQNYPRAIAERLAMYVILYKINRTKDNLEKDIDRLLAETQNPDFRAALENIKRVRFGASVLNYTLTDEKGQKVSLSKYLGKVVLLDFFYTGCGNCVKLTPVLRKVEERFKYRDVVFISISIDDDQKGWLKSVRSQLYCSPLSINLFTSGNGSNDPVIKGMNVQGYPTLALVGKNGRLVPNFKDPRLDDGQDLEKNLLSCLAQ
jgi:thiol-disulfide isomerase/thioredoxin